MYFVADWVFAIGDICPQLGIDIARAPGLADGNNLISATVGNEYGQPDQPSGLV